MAGYSRLICCNPSFFLGGVYIGVGPEQNFSYLSLTRPKLAIIVDIRRDNLLQHLYYRYLFEEARDRSHFIALLVGRPYDEGKAPPENLGTPGDPASSRRARGLSIVP